MNCTGIATLLNTSGAAIGPLLATFFLLPSLGYQTSLICCAAEYALLSILVTERALFSLRRPAGIILATLWIALLIGLEQFSHIDGLKRISNMPAVRMKGTTRACTAGACG